MHTDTDSANIRLESADLPETDDLVFEPLHPHYWWAQFMVLVMIIPIPIGVLAFVHFQANGFDELLEKTAHLPLPTIVVSGFVLLFIIITTFMRMNFSHKGYCLRSADVHAKGGVVKHYIRSLPFSRIQHVEMESGPLDRLFNLTELKFYTAGGGGADLSIPGLKEEKAQKIRAYVLSQARDNVNVSGNAVDEAVSL